MLILAIATAAVTFIKSYKICSDLLISKSTYMLQIHNTYLPLFIPVPP